MFNRLKREDHDEIAFRVLLGFLIAFVPLRAYLFLEYAGIVPKPFVVVGDVHVHHFVFGITVLALAGYVALVAPYFRRKIAWFYGIGLALAFDEFSIWLKLDADYWTRASITAVVLIVGFLINVVYFKRLWLKIWKTTRFVNPVYPIAKHIDRRVRRAKVDALAHTEEVLQPKEHS